MGVVCTHASTHAEEFFLPDDPEDSVVGALGSRTVNEGESLLDIARAHDLGHDQIIIANPTLDRWVPKVGAAVLLPSRYILPPGPRTGIVINLAELRLYFYPPHSDAVLTYPISIGDLDWRTPLGSTFIRAKETDPAWSPPPSIRREHALEGDELPPFIPGGSEDNPLGRHALILGIPRYLIHGTNERRSYGIGMRVSHGCIRLYPEDIEELFDLVAPGTSVRIIDKPIKVGWRRGVLFVEVHRPLEPEERRSLPEPQLDELDTLIGQNYRPGATLQQRGVVSAFYEGSGVATAVGALAESEETPSLSRP